MRGTARALQFTGSGLLILLALLGGLFAAGYAVSDLPALPVTLGIAAWLLAAAGLGWLAWRRPDLGTPSLLGLTVLVGALAVLDGSVDLFGRDATGPVMTVVVLAVLVPLAVLGLRRATEAGLMLVLLAVAQLLGAGLLHAGLDSPGLRGLLGGSSGVVVVPILVAAVLLLVAGRLAHDRVSFWHRSPGAQVAH